MFKKLNWGLVGYCILASIVAISAHVTAYKKFGRDCHEVSCGTGERCIVSHVACEKDERHGEHCGLYPRCVEIETSGDQQLIDTTSTTANARALIFSPSTSTIQLNDQLNQRLSPNPSKDFDRSFELLSQEAGISSLPVSHAEQVQANVLVVVQDGSQQSKINPNLNPSYNLQPWRQPCVVSPYYPYTCSYSASPYIPASRAVPPYANARVATGPQLVPPTPPCYYNCYTRLAGGYPRQTGGYPLARSVQLSSALTNNYLLYI